MHLTLIVVPYDSGQRSYRMGRGPEHLLGRGLDAQLQGAGHDVAVRVLESDQRDAVRSAFELAQQLSSEVRNARRDGRLPVILTGNCVSSLGGLAGLDARVALLWLDAHADLNTPQTSPSGFLDGMALAVITGRCYQEYALRIEGFRPLQDELLLLLGTREIDPGEQPIVTALRPLQDAASLRAALDRIADTEIYVHVDLDVLDPSVLRANAFASAHGLTRAALMACIETVAATKRIATLAISAYDPEYDTADQGPVITGELIAIAARYRK